MVNRYDAAWLGGRAGTHDVNFTVKRISRIIFHLRGGHHELEITEFADVAGRIRDAHAILTAAHTGVVRIFRPGIDFGDEFPAVALGFAGESLRVETRVFAVAR